MDNTTEVSSSADVQTSSHSLAWSLATTIVISVLALESLLWWAYCRQARTAGADPLYRLSKRRSKSEADSSPPAAKPQSVNYHFTRQCNYQCGFCFHTAKTSFVLPIDEAKRGLKLLAEAGEEYTVDVVQVDIMHTY